MPLVRISGMASAPAALIVFGAAAILVGASRRAVAQSPGGAIEPPAATSPAEIARWVEQLDDDSFAAREQAETLLKAIGPAALGEVGAAVESDSLERSTRAVRVLLAWSESAAADKRLAILQRLSQAEGHPTESSFAADQIAIAQEDAALEAIAAMGGTVHDSTAGRSSAYRGPVQIVIGRKWKGGVEGLERLREVRRLASLCFHSAELPDAALNIVEDLPGVSRVEVYGMPQAVERAELLRTQRPGLDVAIRRSGAQLGIQGNPNSTDAVVVMVGKNTAAERAGIRANDVITEVDGVAVGDFNSLTDMISEIQPGETRAMKVRRGEKEIVLSVTFDRWGEDDNFTKQFSPAGMPMNGQIIVRGNGRVIIQQGNGPPIVVPATPPKPQPKR